MYLKSLLALSLISVVLFGLPSFGFAQAAGNEFMQETFANLDMIITFLSWAWIIPATLAGKLMTNFMVYGSAFYMDVYLRKIWIFMRTLAYYTLGFLFLAKIVAHIVKQDDTGKIRDTVGKTVLAGLLIPLSRWFIAVLVDFSIIGTAAVSSFPLQAVQQQREEVKLDLTSSKRVIVVNNSIDIEDLSRPENTKTLELKDIMPQADSVAGPLVFIGAAVLNLFKLGYLAESNSSRSTLTIVAGLKLIITLMLVVPMVVLLIVNVIRIFYIRMRIVFGPFIILDAVFKGPLAQSSTYGKYFNVKNIFGVIFQPVAVVAMLSLGMVFTLGVVDIFVGGSALETESLRELQIEQFGDNQSRIGTGANPEITITGTGLKDVGETIGGIIGELILAAFVAFILRSLLYIGFTFSELTKGTADGIFKFAGSAMKSLPIVPLGGLGTYSLNSLGQAREQIDRKKFGLEKRIDRQGDELTGRIDTFLKLNTGKTLTATERNELSTASTASINGKSPGHFRNVLRQKQKKRSIRVDEAKPWINQRIQNGGAAILKKAGISVNPSDPKAIDALRSGNNTAFRKFVDGMLSGEAGDIPATAGLNEMETIAQTAVEKGSSAMKDVYEPIGKE